MMNISAQLCLAGLLAIVGCSAVSNVTTPTSSGAKYDATYDFSEVQPTPTGTTVFSAARYWRISNNVISSSDGRFSGSVTDNFGNLRATGPCPVNGGSATFTGIVNAGNPKFGQGTYTCTTGGAGNSWHVYNGQ